MKLTDGEIVKALKEEKRIRRVWWLSDLNTRDLYLVITDNFYDFGVWNKYGKLDGQGLNINDLEAIDWEVIDK